MGDPDQSPDPVAERKKQNPAHTDLTTFFFVEHQSFELLGGPWGHADTHKAGIDLGPRELSPDRHWPLASKELQQAQKKAQMGAYLQKHGLRDRWVYVLSVEKGQAPVLRYELRLDDKGRVAYLGRDDFLAVHADPAADTQSDADYLRRPEWKATSHTFLRQKIPIGKAGAPIKWHFVGMGIRLTSAGVAELESDAKFLGPDPGFNFFAKDKDASKVEGVKVWKVGRLVPVGDGVLARVFDPLTIVDGLRRELHLRLDAFIRYSTPLPGDPDAEIRRRRHLVGAIANHADLVCKRSNLVDIRHDELARDTAVWPDLRTSCFTVDDQAILDELKVKPLGLDGPTFFRTSEREVREHYLRAQIKAGTALMLWLSSHSWAFVERQYFSSDERANARGHRFLRVCTEALERLGELDGGRHFLSLLIEQCEERGGTKAKPNQHTLEQFVLRDQAAPKGTIDTAAIAIKAGKAPFSLWSKLLSLVTTMNKSFLAKLVEKHQANIDPKILELLEGLPEQKKVFSVAALVMSRRIRKVYQLNIVENTITAFDLPSGDRQAIFFLPDGSSKGGTKQVVFGLKVGDGAKQELAVLQSKVAGKDLPAPGHRLTFDHISKVTSILGLFFSARDLYISGTEKGALDITKSAFNVFKSVYGLPWVQARVSARVADISLPGLSKQMQVWVAKRGVATIGFVIQIVTVGFAVQDVWAKSQSGTSDEVISSALSLTSEVLLLISAGMVVYSGGTMTPVAAILAGVAAVISVAQFAYSIFRPDEHVYAVRYCMFGVGFVTELGSVQDDARHWQACPGHDLRYFNPKFKGRGLAALETQIASFNNLMHGYAVQLSFTDAVVERGATLKIFPGALPRQAYFEIRLKLEWWLSQADGAIFTEPGDTWTAEYSFNFYPFADNVPPQKPAFAPAFFHQMRRNGVVDVDDGPFDVLVGRHKDRLELYTYPKEGPIFRWRGELNNIVGGTSKPVKIQKKFEVKYKLRSKLVPRGGGRPADLAIQIELLDGTSSDLTLQGAEVTALVGRFSENHEISEETMEVTVVDTPSKNAKGHDVLTIIVPGVASDTTGSYAFKEFELRPNYADRKGSTKPGLGGSTPKLPPGGRVVTEEQMLTPLSDDTFHYRIDYKARLIHTGGAANVEFEATKAFVRKSSDSPAQGYMTSDLFVNAVVLQYVRNEGKGKPMEEGSRSKPRWRLMRREGGDLGTRFSVVLTGSTSNASPVELFDRLTTRFSVRTFDENGAEAWTGGKDDWVEDVKADWSYPTAEQAAAYDDTHLIKAAACEIRLVLDGDPLTHNFSPNDLWVVNRRAYAKVKLETGRLGISWKPPFHRGITGPPESDLVRSILACKT
ncbi:MAG: hypothetical protein AAGF11_21035 [Myxococcota bacterium]